MPPCACLSRPARDRTAPVKAPRFMAERFALEQRFRDRGAIDGHERAFPAGTVTMDRACYQLLETLVIVPR